MVVVGAVSVEAHGVDDIEALRVEIASPKEGTSQVRQHCGVAVRFMCPDALPVVVYQRVQVIALRDMQEIAPIFCTFKLKPVGQTWHIRKQVQRRDWNRRRCTQHGSKDAEVRSA